MVKLRFTGRHIEAFSGPHSDVAFRRKSQSQVKRDRVRLADHKQKRATDALSGNCLPTTARGSDGKQAHVMTTRNKITRNLTDSIEQTRDETYVTPLCMDVSVMSMEPLSPPVTSLIETDLSPLATPFQPIQAIPANPDAESLCEYSTITSDVDTSTLPSPDEYPPDDDDDGDDDDSHVSDASMRSGGVPIITMWVYIV